MYSLHSGRFNN